MNPILRPLRLLFVIGCAAWIAGCNVLKPTTVVTRSFVLTPLATSPTEKVAPENIGVAIAPVRMPQYLLKSPIAVRRGTNEVHYLEDSRWAEPLDQSFQRTLGANLGVLMPTERIRLSSWQREDVTLALYVTVEQFDVDEQGRGVLHAWWRISNPAGDRVLRNGDSRFSKSGTAPFADPHAAAVLLSELTAEFCRSLVKPLSEAALATPGIK